MHWLFCFRFGQTHFWIWQFNKIRSRALDSEWLYGFLVDLHGHSVKFRFVLLDNEKLPKICLWCCCPNLYRFCIVYGRGQSAVLYLLEGAQVQIWGYWSFGVFATFEVIESISVFCASRVCWSRVVRLRCLLTHQNLFVEFPIPLFNIIPPYFVVVVEVQFAPAHRCKYNFVEIWSFGFFFESMHIKLIRQNKLVCYSFPCYAIDFQS